MGYYMDSEWCDDLHYTPEERERLTEDFQALCCGPEVEQPAIEYADYDAFEFLDAEDFNVTEVGDGSIIVHGFKETVKATGFIDEIHNVLSMNLGADKGRCVWIMSGEDGETWPVVHENGHKASSPKMTTVYKVHISDTEMEVRGDDA